METGFHDLKRGGGVDVAGGSGGSDDDEEEGIAGVLVEGVMPEMTGEGDGGGMSLEER